MSWIDCSGPTGGPLRATSPTTAPRPGVSCLPQTAAEGSRRMTGPYLARLVASRTGLSQPDAERRVDDAIAAATTAVRRARRSAVIVGFATAASLLIGAAAGWWAACAGG